MISSINTFATMRPSSYLLVLYKLMEAQMADGLAGSDMKCIEMTLANKADVSAGTYC
jgi:hypothetical protein